MYSMLPATTRLGMLQEACPELCIQLFVRLRSFRSIKLILPGKVPSLLATSCNTFLLSSCSTSAISGKVSLAFFDNVSQASHHPLMPYILCLHDQYPRSPGIDPGAGKGRGRTNNLIACYQLQWSQTSRLQEACLSSACSALLWC
jgi:hypothetical protein